MCFNDYNPRGVPTSGYLTGPNNSPQPALLRQYQQTKGDNKISAADNVPGR